MGRQAAPILQVEVRNEHCALSQVVRKVQMHCRQPETNCAISGQ